MRARFIVRLLDEAHTLLAWTEVLADAKPQERGASCPFWPVAQTQFPIEQDGIASLMTIHWADLDVARVQKIMEPVPVQVGQVANFAWVEPIWLVPGMRDVPLPPVTVRQSITLSPPTGTVFAKDSRE